MRFSWSKCLSVSTSVAYRNYLKGAHSAKPPFPFRMGEIRVKSFMAYL